MENTLLKSSILAFLAAITIFFSPVGDAEAEASTVSSSELVEAAKASLGIKYVYGGTTRKGFDCSGYLQYTYKQLGVNLPRTSGSMYNTGTWVNKASLKVGDLVFFGASPGSKRVTHAGMYIGDNKFIHSSSSKGVSVTSINDKYYWGNRYIGAKRVAQVD